MCAGKYFYAVPMMGVEETATRRSTAIRPAKAKRDYVGSNNNLSMSSGEEIDQWQTDNGGTGLLSNPVILIFAVQFTKHTLWPAGKRGFGGCQLLLVVCCFDMYSTRHQDWQSGADAKSPIYMPCHAYAAAASEIS